MLSKSKKNFDTFDDRIQMKKKRKIIFRCIQKSIIKIYLNMIDFKKIEFCKKTMFHFFALKKFANNYTIQKHIVTIVFVWFRNVVLHLRIWNDQRSMKIRRYIYNVFRFWINFSKLENSYSMILTWHDQHRFSKFLNISKIQNDKWFLRH